MKVNLIISIDTECDKDENWNIPHPITYRNIEYGLEQTLIPLFDKYGIKATYLLSPEIIQNDNCVTKFKSFKNIELGTHLHTEFIEPFAIIDPTNTNAIQASLSKKVEHEKLYNLTALFKAKFGYQPLSFRAGRFGISKHTFAILNELNYKIDSSVTPFKTLYFDDRIINNWGYKPWPYAIKGTKLMQVPVSIINTQFNTLPGFVLKQMQDKPNFLKKVFHKLGYTSQTQWFRPMRENGDGLIATANAIINATPKNIVPTLNMMFHSNEILPGTSPYCKTQEDVNSFLSSLDETFAYLFKNYTICSIGLGEYSTR
jgi:hypothetical protein